MLEYAGAYVWCMYLIKLTLAKNLCRSQCDLLTRYRERLGSFKCIHHLREMWKLEITQFNLNFIIGNIHLLLLVLMFRATEINFLNLTFFLNLAKLYFQNYGVKEVQGTWQFSNGHKDWKVKIKNMLKSSIFGANLSRFLVISQKQEWHWDRRIWKSRQKILFLTSLILYL